MATSTYYPELGGKRPEKMDGRVSGYGKQVTLSTPLNIKGRGVRHCGVLTSSQLTKAGQYRVGWNEYTVTAAALSKLEQQYEFVREGTI